MLSHLQLECLVQDASLRASELQVQNLKLAEELAEGLTKRAAHEKEEAQAISKLKVSTSFSEDWLSKQKCPSGNYCSCRSSMCLQTIWNPR